MIYMEAEEETKNFLVGVCDSIMGLMPDWVQPVLEITNEIFGFVLDAMDASAQRIQGAILCTIIALPIIANPRAMEVALAGGGTTGFSTGAVVMFAGLLAANGGGGSGGGNNEKETFKHRDSGGKKPKKPEGSSKATTVLRNELSQSKSSQVWGELSDGTNQGIKHFADYWELYPERIPSIAGRLGVDPSKFAKTAEGFKNFTDEALRITKTEGVQIKDIGDKKIYFMNGAENAKKGVVVIMKEGKLQSMMPSELRSFLKMQ